MDWSIELSKRQSAVEVFCHEFGSYFKHRPGANFLPFETTKINKINKNRNRNDGRNAGRMSSS